MPPLSFPGSRAREAQAIVLVETLAAAYRSSDLTALSRATGRVLSSDFTLVERRWIDLAARSMAGLDRKLEAKT